MIRLAIFITLQFARDNVKTCRTDIRIEDKNAVFLVALVWISFNLVFSALHQVGIPSAFR